MTLHKSYGVRFKAHKDDAGQDTGEVTAIVSVFGNVDTVGDRVVKGAFTDSLAEWKDSGDPIPMVWSHDWNNPMSHIGQWDASKAVETDEGLELTGQVDLESENPVAKQAFWLMKSRRVREFSFAYDVQDEKKSDDGANELLKLGLIEAGPTLKGANTETRLLAAKALEAAGAKVGRAISSKNEQTLRDAAEAMDAAAKSIKSVLSSLDTESKSGPDEDMTNEGGPDPETKDSDPDDSKALVEIEDQYLKDLEDAEIEFTLYLSDDSKHDTEELDEDNSEEKDENA